VCDGLYLARAARRGVCGPGNVIDASRSGPLARASLDQRSRGRDDDLGVLNRGGRLVVAHDHAQDVNCDFRCAIRNSRALVAGAVRDAKSEAAEEDIGTPVYTDGNGLIRITVHAS